MLALAGLHLMKKREISPAQDMGLFSLHRNISAIDQITHLFPNSGIRSKPGQSLKKLLTERLPGFNFYRQKLRAGIDQQINLIAGIIPPKIRGDLYSSHPVHSTTTCWRKGSSLYEISAPFLGFFIQALISYVMLLKTEISFNS
jgi:hypothetical protein